MARDDGGTRLPKPEILADRWERIGSPRLLVFGELWLDRTTRGDAERISLEAPVPVLRTRGTTEHPGGSAGLALACRALGARVGLAGIIGDDEAGTTLCRLLEQAEIDLGLLRVDPLRATLVRQRVVGAPADRAARAVVELVTESPRAIDPILETRLGVAFHRAVAEVDAVLIAPDGCGSGLDRLTRTLIERARELNRPVVVAADRGADLQAATGATCLVLSRAAAAAAVGARIGSVGAAQGAAEALVGLLDLKAVVIRLDRDQLVCARSDGGLDAIGGSGRERCETLAAWTACLATLGVSLGAGLALRDAVELAQLAGSAPATEGRSPIDRGIVLAELTRRFPRRPVPSGPSKVVGRHVLATLLAHRREQGERVVLTIGGFDLLHPGHLWLLSAARARGDCLVVAVRADGAINRRHGSGWPVFRRSERAALLAAFELVDFVAVLDAVAAGPDDELAATLDLIDAVRPAVWVQVAGDYPDRHEARDRVEEAGGEVVVLPPGPSWTTAQLISHLDQRPAAPP